MDEPIGGIGDKRHIGSLHFWAALIPRQGSRSFANCDPAMKAVISYADEPKVTEC